MLQRLKKPILTDYQIPLEIAAKSMIRFKKPERLIRMIIRMISSQIDITHVAILLYVKAKKYYKLIESKGGKGDKIPIGFARLDPDNALIRIFVERKNRLIDKDGVLVLQDLKKVKDKDLNKLMPEITHQMEILGAVICVPSYFKNQLLGVLALGKKNSGATFTRREIGLLVTLANDAAMAISNAQLIESLQYKIKEVKELYIKEHQLFIHTSIALATAIDAKDPYTHGHTARVTRYSLAIFREMESEECTEESLHIAALLHDIGKIGIPDDVLKKKQGLKDAERTKMEEHAVIGATILTPIRKLGVIVEGVKHHHEKFDGSGYPDGLKDGQIPFISRVIAVADTFDAITTDRPYRKKKDTDVAVKEILDNSGTQFDPVVVEAFSKAYENGKIISKNDI